MRLVSINFAANLRFGSCFPALPTNYCGRVGQQKLWQRQEASTTVMRWLLQVMGHIQSLEIEEENELASLEVMLVQNSDNPAGQSATGVQ